MSHPTNIAVLFAEFLYWTPVAICLALVIKDAINAWKGK